jgi:putative redox protein
VKPRMRERGASASIPPMSHHASVTSSSDTLRQEIVVDGRHLVLTDEPESLGGEDTAPTPLDLLAAALAGCVVTTIRMFARRQGWRLDELSADVSLDTSVRPARCEIAVRLPEGLSETQWRRLEHVARACAVHRTLERGMEFEHSIAFAAPSAI